MSTSKDWLANDRQGILNMAQVWREVINTNATDWNIPAAVVTEFVTLTIAAESALEAAKNEATRTPVVNAQCRAAFDVLIARMRDIKRRYLLVPPLDEPGLVSLGLRVHDSHPTPSGSPTSQVRIETYLVGRHELGVKILYTTGNPDDPANKGYRIWYSVVEPDVTITDPDELRKSFYTKRKKDVIEFGFGDSGKTAWFAVQVENDGKKGPWGSLVNALIP